MNTVNLEILTQSFSHTVFFVVFLVYYIVGKYVISDAAHISLYFRSIPTNVRKGGGVLGIVKKKKKNSHTDSTYFTFEYKFPVASIKKHKLNRCS